jgi:hypothetical protein
MKRKYLERCATKRMKEEMLERTDVERIIQDSKE